MSFFSYPRTHILITVTVGYVFGILLSAQFSLPTATYIIILGIITLLFIFSLKSAIHLSLIAVMLFFITIGHYSGVQSSLPPESPHHIGRLVANNENEESVIIGTIHRLHSFNGTSSRSDLNVQAVRDASSKFISSHGMVRFTLPAPFPLHISPGDTVAIRASLKKPTPPLVPGSFDYSDYLAKHNIYAIGFIKSPLHIQKVVKKEKETLFHTMKYWPERLRNSINRFIDSRLDADTASIYKALLTGDRSSVSPEIIEHFKGAGVLHILAISGLHMSLLGIFSYGICFYLLRRSTWLIKRINTRKTAALFCVLPILFYTLIAGVKTPVFRSFLMSLVVILSVCQGRKHSFGSLLACAALIILVISPAELFTPSFQLSFAAVMAIGAAIPLITATNNALTKRFEKKKTNNILRWTVAGIMVSLAATIGTTPLLLYHFNRISLVGVVANLVVEPLLCFWSLLLGFIAIIFMPIWQSAAALLLHAGSLGIVLADEATAFFATLPLSTLFYPSPSSFHIALFYIFLCHFFFFKKRKPYTRIIISCLFGFTLLTMFIPFKEITKNQQDEAVLSYLAVGHGSTTFLEMVGGRRIVIDAGALSSPGFDIGRSTIAPFLLSKGVRRVDDIVITHPDSDHYNGALFLLKHFKVKNLWISIRMSQESGWQKLLGIAKEKDTNIIIGRTGQYIARDSEDALVVLANTAEGGYARSDNDRGLVLKYVHRDFSAIFPGDISVVVEKELIANNVDLRGEVLLAAHHGSTTSNSQQFLETVAPEIFIVSSGRNCKVSRPESELAVRCRKLGINLIPLNKAGTITLTSRSDGYFFETYMNNIVYNEKDGLPKVIKHR